MKTGRDVLELLLPDVDEAGRDQACRVVTFLRLLADDARAGGARSLPRPQRAEEEWAARGRSQLQEALIDLLRHTWNACLEQDSFLDGGEPRLDYQEAWSQLEGARGRETPGVIHSAVPAVPRPGEDADSVLGRLIAAGPALGLSDEEVELWSVRARLVAERDPALASTCLKHLRDSDAPPALVEDALADLAACRLDRGDVAGAARCLADGTLLPGRRAETLASWCRTLLGEVETSLFAGAAGRLPRPLIELREARPDLLFALAGAPVQGRRQRPRWERVLDRESLGARLLQVISFQGGEASIERSEEAPGAAVASGSSTGGEARPWMRPGAPEHELLLEARTVLRREDGAPSLALVPLRDGHGAPRGWLRLEWDHRLLPSVETLEELAATLPRPEGVTPRLEEPDGDEYQVGRRLFAELVRELGIKTQHRRWWGILVEESPGGDGGPILQQVAGGGSGLTREAARGGAQGVARACAAGGVVLLDEGSQHLCLHADAASGIVVPARFMGGVSGLFVVESTRRRDFKQRDAQRMAEVMEQRALALRCAAFDAWHRRRYGHGLGLAHRVAAFKRRALQVHRGARARTPVAILGTRGSGRGVLGRWLHFESACADAPLVEVRARDLGRLPELGPSAALLVRELEELDPAHIARLLELVSAGRAVTVTARELDGLDPELVRVLGRYPIRLGPLSERREELGVLIAALAGRAAEWEGLEPLVLTDDALALLWRQPWEGGLGELEHALYRLTLELAGETVDARTVEEVLGLFGMTLLRRLPSRHPKRSDVEAALAVTRKESGRMNKSRAALYLGWDPDTLVARMGDLGIEG